MAVDLFFVALLALASSLAIAYDPSPLQDFCVAVKASPVFVNGLVCEDPKLAKPEDFFFGSIDKHDNTSNPVGLKVNLVSASQIPGLNTLGVSIAHIILEPHGVTPPHTHPRATEIIIVLEGSLYAGFVTSSPDNKLYAKVLKKGDVFAFPEGLIHFQFNSGDSDAVAIAAFNSQNPGVIITANAVFGAKPAIPDEVLTKSFNLDKKTVDWLKTQF